MDVAKYLSRITYSGVPEIDVNTLVLLHERHVYNIPFENLDVQDKTKIRLEKNHLSKKIISNFRGGFCYELNYLFSLLLSHIGFEVKLISAQIIKGQQLGPEFDHMALIIKLDQRSWLADVGFGDLFVKPLNINREGEQYDGRNHFKIVNQGKTSFLLTMSKDGANYEKKYVFNTKGRRLEDFFEQCAMK